MHLEKESELAAATPNRNRRTIISNLACIRLNFSAVIILAIIGFACRWTATTCQEQCPGRDVQSLRHSAANAELGLILYYTSWNKESVAAWAEYVELAQYYYDDVYFASVDCWHLRCNCSGTHIPIGAGSLGTPHRWPTLIVYFGRGIVMSQYSGEWDFASISGFMANLFNPVDRVHSRNELRALVHKSDAVVLGLFPNIQTLQHNNRQYNRFVAASVKWLENDPERSYRFAVAIGSASRDVLGDTKNSHIPQIVLISRTAITNYNVTGSSALSVQKWYVSQIVHWTLDEFRRSLPYAYGNSNPTSLAIRVRHGHTLAIFATDFELHKLIDGVLDFPSARATFQTCDNFWKQTAAKADYLFYKQLEDKHNAYNEHQCVLENALNWENLADYYMINAYLNQRFHQFIKTEDSLYDVLNEDELSAANLLDLHRYRQCLKHPYYSSQELRIATSKYLKKSIDKLFPSTNTTGTHLHNRTLSLVILDMDKFKDYNFYNRGSLNLHASAASAFIIDPHKENIFAMPERFSYDAILSFVKQYYDGYPITPYSSNSEYHFTPNTANELHLHEYNREMFLQAVHVHQLQVNATTIVALLYSPECAFYSVISHTLLQLSVFLNSNDIKFIRINTLTNDLPWEFVMPGTPTLLVFPRGHYPESRVFPTHFKVNVRNLLGFILAQLQPVEQVKIVLDSCKQAIVPSRQQQCFKFAKGLVMQHISSNLKYWQIFENERNFILSRLKEFKDLSLAIQSSSRL